MATRFFQQHFQLRPTLVASAPGRLEVLGNHTDYNEGFVLSCAVGQRTSVALCKAPSGTAQCRVVSAFYPEQEIAFDINQASGFLPSKSWGNYVRAVVAQLQARGVKVPAFFAAIESDLPPSAGMSSSAALEVALIKGLLMLAGKSLTALEIARVGQGAESQAVGARTGLMDQLTSCLGKAQHLVLSEYRNFSVHHVPMSGDYVFVVADSGEKHDLSHEYNDRREACERSVATLVALEKNVTSLRDVSSSMLAKHEKALGKDLPFAKHVVEENERVLLAEKLLLKQDFKGFGALLFASHESSMNNFNNSSAGQNRLVALAKADQRCLGARLSGGGFGGVTLHLVKAADALSYATSLAAKAQAQDDRAHWCAVTTLGDGPLLSFNPVA